MTVLVWLLNRCLRAARREMVKRGVNPAVLGLALGAMAASLAVGCSGSGVAQFVSILPTEIDPPATSVWRMDAQQCYWWTDEAGELNVAMTCTRNNLLLGTFGRLDFDISFVLGDPPAGSGRNYPVQQRETRSIFVSALQNQRLISNAGIVGVNVRDDGTLRGSFRTWMVPVADAMSLSFLPQQTGPLLCFGTFQAVKDEARGKAIRARCEAGGWVRPPRQPPRAAQTTATRPVASQPSEPRPATTQGSTGA
jgi:hypothetical protein